MLAALRNSFEVLQGAAYSLKVLELLLSILHQLFEFLLVDLTLRWFYDLRKNVFSVVYWSVGNCGIG